jgi:hypothetical protein
MWRVVALLLLLAGSAGCALADATVPICHEYGCQVETDIVFVEARLERVARLLRLADDAEGERRFLAVALGWLYGWAGEQSVVRNDRGGNYADGEEEGRMDCIDHSISTTRLLRLLEARKLLRWHRVLEPEVRHRALFFGEHWSAVIEDKKDKRRYVLDSWFVNNGEPAVLLPLDDWKEGAGPDV